MKLPPLPDAGHPMLQWAPDAQHDLRAYGLACARAALEQAMLACRKRASRDFPWGSENSDIYHAQADWAEQCEADIEALAKEVP